MTNVNILKMPVSVTSIEQVTTSIMELAKARTSSYVCISNVHMCMETFDSKKFEEVLNQSDIVVPDGRPIYWALKLLGFSLANQVRGQDLMNELCRLSQTSNVKIGLYGGADDEVLSLVKETITSEYPNVDITFAYSPPFRSMSLSEREQVINMINDASVGILFVGVGCPKQEYWMAQHKGDINSVMLGVGAAFDFISGNKRHAPKWMQYIGLEWFFRLVSEPRRLWKRYLKQNPRFIYYFLQQWLLKRDFTKEGPENV